jgi:hypothetical protein
LKKEILIAKSEMETIKFTVNKARYHRNMNNKKLNLNEIRLIKIVNLIMEVIMTNSLKFNKLTSAEEIHERLSASSNEDIPDQNTNKYPDLDSIKYICDAFCVEKGVLIKLEKNNESFYKLNYLEDV